MKLAMALKASGLLDAELLPSEMVMQAEIVLQALEDQGIEITLK